MAADAGLGRVGHGDADQLEPDAGAVGDVVGAGEEDLGEGAPDVAATEQRRRAPSAPGGRGPPPLAGSARRRAASPGPRSPPNGTGCPRRRPGDVRPRSVSSAQHRVGAAGWC